MALSLVVSFLLLQFVCSQKEYSFVDGRPDFCKGAACPLFKVLKSNSTVYEIREYGPERWAAIDMLNQPLVFATKKAMFMPLNKFISSKKVPASTPLLFRSSLTERKFTMMMYIPKSFNETLSNRREVYLAPKRGFIAYVRSFSGDPNSNYKWQQEIIALKDALIRDNIPFKHNAFYSAIYDQPWLTWTEHNEVWFIGSK